MMGLPGSGKSTYIHEKYSQSAGYTLVSADDIRLNHPEYNPKFPDGIHEQCVKDAEELMYINGKRNGDIIYGEKFKDYVRQISNIMNNLDR